MVVWKEVLWTAVQTPRDFGFIDAQRALENGANASTVCPNRHTALWWAVRSGSPDTVKLLLNAGATANYLGSGPSLFRMCVRHIDSEMLHSLFRSGVLDTVDELCFYKAMRQIAKSNLYCDSIDDSLDITRMCIQHAVARGYNLSRLLNAPDQMSRTHLHHATASACSLLRVPLVEMLVDYGVDVSRRDRDGHTAEDLARLQPNLEMNIDARVVAILEKERIRVTNLVAFAMGYHHRLGQASAVRALDLDNLREICEMVGAMESTDS